MEQFKNIIIYGASVPHKGGGGHGKVVADIVERAGSTIHCFLDDDANYHGKEFFGYRVFGGGEKLDELRKAGFSHALVSVGENGVRKKITALLESAGFDFALAIHPSAVIGRGVVLGKGTVVAARAVINPDARVGKHCIINTGAIVEHDNILGSYVHIAPGVNLGGRVSVGDETDVFTNATVLPDVIIGKNCTIGAGAVVLKDVPDGATVIGNPACILKKS